MTLTFMIHFLIRTSLLLYVFMYLLTCHFWYIWKGNWFPALSASHWGSPSSLRSNIKKISLSILHSAVGWQYISNLSASSCTCDDSLPLYYIGIWCDERQQLLIYNIGIIQSKICINNINKHKWFELSYYCKRISCSQ